METKKAKPAWIRKKQFPPHVYRHRNGRYYLRTFAGGKEKWASLKTDILEVAKARLKEHQQAADAQRVTGVRSISGPLHFDEALRIFTHRLQNSSLRPNTRAFHQAGAKLVQRSWANIDSANLSRITAWEVVEWLRKFVADAKPHIPPNAKSPARNTTGASVTTLKCALGSLRQILDVAVDSGHLPANPARHELVMREMQKLTKKIRRDRRERNLTCVIPSKGDFSNLVQTVRSAGVSDCRASADFIEFIAYCGARKNEAINVQWQDIDFLRGLINLRVTKNGEPRWVPMFDEMRSLLKRLKEERAPRVQSDNVLLVKEAQGFITSACRKLGIPRFTTHGLRHFFGTTCLEAGADVRTVAKWLGHKDNGALLLKIYSHVRPDHEKEMVKKVRFKASASN